MSKVSKDFENPIDNIFYDRVSKDLDFYYELGLTPNHITTLSLLFGFLTAYFVQTNNKIIAVICLLISYYYDCMDGALARKYKLYSSFGDLYDHASDIFKFGVIVYTMYLMKPDKLKNSIPFFGILAVILGMQYGCQEKYFNSETKDILGALSFMCPNKDMIKYTRYFGGGSFIVIFAIYIMIF
jgi:phosphatidylglycerophosphate synthase